MGTKTSTAENLSIDENFQTVSSLGDFSISESLKL